MYFPQKNQCVSPLRLWSWRGQSQQACTRAPATSCDGSTIAIDCSCLYTGSELAMGQTGSGPNWQRAKLAVSQTGSGNEQVPRSIALALDLSIAAKLACKAWKRKEMTGMKAIWRGQLIAESDCTREVGGYIYFPRDAVHMDLLSAAPRSPSDLACPH